LYGHYREKWTATLPGKFSEIELDFDSAESARQFSSGFLFAQKIA
jgi:hypothetical protein